MTTCQECGRPGASVLGIRAHRATRDHFERWRQLHGGCFDAAGYSYGVDHADLVSRGSEFWARHIGEKTWAEFTDYRVTFPGRAA